MRVGRKVWNGPAGLATNSLTTELGKYLRRCLLCLGIAVVTAVPARPQSTPQDLGNKSIEDLMNMEVNSVSKKDEKLSRTAAAVFVITQEDIRRSGARNIPDLLRMVPGLDVAQIDGSTWAISARGFNDQYSNKLLVMIDRRIVYTPTDAGVYWDTLDLPFEDIERIEVIRGPGGSVWGANAVNGVISIFTKKAGSTSGALVEAGGGNIDQGFGTVQYGGTVKNDTQYRVYAKYLNVIDPVDLSGQNPSDNRHQLRGGFRTDTALSAKDSLMVEGDLYVGGYTELSFVLPAVTSPALLTVNHLYSIGGGFLETVWNHTYSDHSDSTLQFSYTGYRRDDPELPERRNTFDLDYERHFRWGERQDINWGLGYRYTTDRILGSLTVSFNPASRDLQLFNSFVQDEISLVPDRLYLTLGSKLEHNAYTGLGILPSARLAWTLSKRHMMWTAISRVLRNPARSDTAVTVNLRSFPGPGGVPVLLRLEGNPDFQNEKLLAYEIGYRTTVSDRLSIDLTGYYNDYTNIQSTEPGTPFFEPTPLPAHLVLPLEYQNLIYGETHGVELAANGKITNYWQLSAGYAFEQIYMHNRPGSLDTATGPFIDGNAPRESIQIRSHVDWHKGLAWDTSAYFVDRLVHQGVNADLTVPSYTRLDSSLTWNLKERFSVALVGQNLLRDHHLEFQDHNANVESTLVKRSVYAKIIWQF